MSKELNIAEILKDKPQGTKLYSPICGDVWLAKFDEDGFTVEYPITVSKEKDNGIKALNTLGFTAQGQYMKTGERLLFPSKNMHDWEKFTWEKGDVLMDNYGIWCMFNGWVTDDFTQFHSEYSYTIDPNNNQTFYQDKIFSTINFRKVGLNAQNDFIKTLEKEYGGKFKPETLEIEHELYTKQIEDMPKKYEFKPFDKVLVRDDDDEAWQIGFYSSYEDTDVNYPYRVISQGCSSWAQCIPYDGNEELVGTSNKPKEGGKE